MIPLFLGLTLANLIGLITAAVIGVAAQRSQWHMLAGVLAAILCCAVHCSVFTYFIATAKWVQHAIVVRRLEPTLAAPTRSFKQQAFPAALLAMAATVLAATTGAAADNLIVPLGWHRTLAMLAIGINVAVAVIEYRAIRDNSLLIDRVLKLANRSHLHERP